MSPRVCPQTGISLMTTQTVTKARTSSRREFPDVKLNHGETAVAGLEGMLDKEAKLESAIDIDIVKPTQGLSKNSLPWT
jgi:hypothetical protein